MNKVLLFTLFVSCICFANAQTTKGGTITNTDAAKPEGNTYALIVGISKYQKFPSLNYADRDAIAFYHFLRSNSGGNTDSANIRLLLNEDAKAGNIWMRGISWLTRKAINKGDKVYIYFSGHGDAANEEEAYLLANDAPNEGDP